jgi:hypothetical protein
MIWFSRRLLSAHATRATGDADLPDALHLRLIPDNAIGLPLTPFLVYPMGTRPMRAYGELVDNGDGTRRVIVPEIAARDGVIVAAEALSHDSKHDWLAAMHGDGLRIAVKRSQHPHQIAAPRLDQLRVSQSVEAVRFFSARPTDLEKLVMGKPPYPPLALPIAAELPWYAGGDGRDAGVKRVMAGAPLRLTPVDRPDGPRASLTPDDEWARLASQVDDLDGMLAAMLGQDGQTPAEILLAQNGVDENGVMQSISSQILSDVMLRSVDPGIARYLGFAAAFDDRGGTPREGEIPALGAVALFALPRGIVQQLSRFGAGPPDGEPDPALIEAFARLFPGVERALDLARKFDHWIGAISTVAAAPPQPDTPEIPGLDAQQGRWRSSDDGGSFAQGFVIRRPPLAPLVAVARDERGWTPRHDMSEAGRHAIRLVGTRIDPSPPQGQAAETQGIVYDDPIPGNAPPRYRFALGDLFGRYGPPAECDAIAPPRPAPPRPVVQSFIRRAAPLPPAGAVSPGALDLRVPIPSLDDLALGALPIAAVRVTLGAAAHNEVAGGESMLQRSYGLPPLEPLQVMLLDLAVRFIDSAGTESEPFTQQLEIADARAPVPIPFGYGLIWTSRPGAAQDVQLALDWPAPAGQQHRAYVADAASLGLAGASRAAIADAGVKRALAGEIAGAEVRKCFRLLTDEPVAAGGDGVVRFRSTLPRALQTVQFVRIVPISAGGVEADFDACGLVPVAVPADRAPPPPRLRVLAANEGSFPTLRIETTGLNLALLERAEPGLFAGGDPARAAPPEYRLRRASGAIPDPIYAREAARGPLARDGAGGGTTFVVSLQGDADPAPYVRYTYWAEIRMPPERRVLEPEVPVADAVAGAAAAQMAHCPAIWSPVSAPLTIVHAPAGKPPAPLAADIDARFVVADARIELTLHNAPPPGPGGQWLLRIWRSADDGALEQVAPDTPVSSDLIQWNGTIVAGTAQVGLAVALVDPLGRQGQMTQVAVENA